MTYPSPSDAAVHNTAPEIEVHPATIYPGPAHPWPTIEETLVGLVSYIRGGIHGVEVRIDEAARHADILLTVPAALPATSREQLKPFALQRVEYMPADAEHDALRNPNDEPDWEQASDFAHGVNQACNEAEGVLLDAAMAMANGLAWTNHLRTPVHPLRHG